MRIAFSWILSAALVASCGDDEVGPGVRFDPDADETGEQALDWLRFPFPADHRRLETGEADFTDFPNPNRIGILTDYVWDASALDGFSIAAPVYLAFETPIGFAELPTDLGAFTHADAPLQIVDITADSPEYGRRYPLRWEYFGPAATYVPGDTLAVGPAWGFPLRERTTYALLVTDAVRTADGDALGRSPLLAYLLGDNDEKDRAREIVGGSLLGVMREQWAPLRALLKTTGPKRADVVAATVFTTQSITPELSAIHAQMSAAVPPAPRADGWVELGGVGTGVYWEARQTTWNGDGDIARYWALEGRFTVPNYQRGTRPYSGRGGSLNVNGGVPEVVEPEEIRFVLTIPESPPPDAGPCYPIVEYAHGTGGTAWGFAGRTAGRMAARGLAGIGIDQPLHGPRYTTNDFQLGLYSFNFLNPEAARSMFRQSAIDTFALTRMLRAGLTVPPAQSPTGSEICFDADRILFFGHSQGGLSGSIAAAFDSDIDAWIFSGAGGGFGITLVERNDDTFRGVKQLFIDDFLLPTEQDVLTENHPFSGLLQTLVDITDPLSYGQYWITRGDFSAPTHIMMTSGHHDEQTPWRTGTALAASGRIPMLNPAVLPAPQYDVLDVGPTDAPVSSNLDGKTAGYLQWTNDIGGLNMDTHFVIFNRPEAINASMRFLESAAYESVPVIERDPFTDAR